MEMILVIPIAVLVLIVIWARLEAFPGWLCVLLGFVLLVNAAWFVFTGKGFDTQDWVSLPLQLIISMLYVFVGFAKLMKAKSGRG